MRFHSGLILTCAFLAAAAGIGAASSAHAEGHGLSVSALQSNSGQNTNTISATSFHVGSQSRTAVVLRFAVQSQPLTDAAALSAQACPQSAGNAPPLKSFTVDPAILDKITEEMQKRLAKKMIVMVNPDPQTIPVGALVISGCITRADAGNAVTRLVGMTLGSSHLGVHVVALARTKDGWNPVDTFDLEVKGGDLLPPLGPIGLAAHAARDTRQTLSADAKKLADHILKRLAKDRRAREQTRTAS